MRELSFGEKDDQSGVGTQVDCILRVLSPAFPRTVGRGVAINAAPKPFLCRRTMRQVKAERHSELRRLDDRFH